MLILDMQGSSNCEPERIVAEHCSRFGSATVIRLPMPDERREYGIAAVKMRSSAEANAIARKFGDARFGRIVLIRLRERNARPEPCMYVELPKSATMSPSSFPHATEAHSPRRT